MDTQIRFWGHPIFLPVFVCAWRPIIVRLLIAVPLVAVVPPEPLAQLPRVALTVAARLLALRSRLP